MSEKKWQLLLVDDDPTLLEVVGRRLEHEGFAVVTALDGEEALSRARAAPPDLIILDLIMPRCDGFEACKILRQDQRFQRVPIIFFTGKLQEMDQMKLRQCGADAFVTKQGGSKALIEQANALLGRTKP